MIKNLVQNADAYSSPEAASRTDEQVPSLVLTDRVTSFTYGLGSPVRYSEVKSDVTFGWDGDIWQGPIPKLDPNYDTEFGIDELAGKEGEHGGHLWSLQMMKQAFDQEHNNPEQAFELMTYVNTSKEHNLELLGQKYPSLASYKPLNDAIAEEYGDSIPQIQKAMYDLPEQYGSQYNSTGAGWDLEQTSDVRWTDIDQTSSEAIAGQHSAEETPGIIQQRIGDRLGG